MSRPAILPDHADLRISRTRPAYAPFASCVHGQPASAMLQGHRCMRLSRHSKAQPWNHAAGPDNNHSADLHQCCWHVELGHPARGQHHDAVVVGDGVQPMRDGQHRALSESCPDGALDQRVRRRVDLQARGKQGSACCLCSRAKNTTDERSAPSLRLMLIAAANDARCSEPLHAWQHNNPHPVVNEQQAS